MDLTISIADAITRMVVAALLGAVVGWERESKNKPAGLRTHMLVSVGAASFTLLIFEMYSSLKATGQVGDPLRIIEAIVGGIGFLGAGTIIQSRGSVEGITTAASIWVVGAVGVASGAAQYVIASITVVLAFMILSIMHLLTPRLKAPEGRAQL
jgi:putative Mg2+ transporter-C (MgtC) family protein